MRPAPLLATLLPLATARITNISAPHTLCPSRPFTLSLTSENYIQSVADIAVAWGYALAPGYPSTLGSFTNSSYLGPSESNLLGRNVSIETRAPEGLEQWVGKEVVLAASVMSLYGASASVVVSEFNVTVEVGQCC